MFNISNCKTLLKELTCKQCSKLLSFLPVYYCSAVGNICGRCVSAVDWMISNGTLERAVAYEAVAKFLIFPCINQSNGCEIKLKVEDVKEHEKTCKAEPISCPFNIELGLTSLKCDWKGTTLTVIQHLHVDHNDYLQIGLPSFIMNIYETHVKNFFTTIDGQTFLVITKFLKPANKFYLSVMCCNSQPNHQYYRYQLEVGRYNDYFLVFRKQSTEKFCNVSEIIDNHDIMITIDVTSVLLMLQDTVELIHCKLSILKKNKKEITDIMAKLGISTPPTIKSKPKPANIKSSPKTKNGVTITKIQVKTSPKPSLTPATASKITIPPLIPNLSSKTKIPPLIPNLSPKLTITPSSSKKENKFLEELECPVCNQYMIPPIFICPTGHSICNQCKEKLQICPTCRIPMQDTRNFTLEKLTASIKYPCCYMEFGCTVMLNAEHIKMHELHCNYAYGKCPLKFITPCNAEDIVDMIGHIREKHPSIYVETNRQYVRDIGTKVTSTYWATSHENEVFIICCKHSSTTGPIRFNVLHVGMSKSRPKYRFQLEFCDQTSNGLKFIISQLCQVFPQNPSVMLKKCLTIPIEMLEPFVVSKPLRRLYFKFCIQRL